MKITKLTLILAACVLALISCQDSTEKLTNAIPANAGYVMHINTQSLIQKSEYDIFQNITVTRGINMAKAFLTDQAAIDMLDAFTKDVNSLGVNIKNDCYVYSDLNTYGIILGVNDAEKIKKALVSFKVAEEKDITVQDGIYLLSPSSGAIVGWTKDKLLLLVDLNINNYQYSKNKDKQLDIVAQAKKQLTQGGKESINSNPAFASFMSNKKDISMFYSYSSGSTELLSKTYGVDLPKEISDELNNLKGVSSTAFISFEKGEIKMDSKTYYDNAETEKKYQELVSQLSGSIKGEQFKYIPENSIFMASANIKGGGIFEYLNKLKLMPAIEDMDHKGVIKSLLTNVDGDITFALSNLIRTKKSYPTYDGEIYEYDGNEPEMTIIANCKNGAEVLGLVKTSLEDGKGQQVIEIEPNTYSTDGSEGIKTYLGVKENMFYMTNNEAIFNSIKSNTPLTNTLKNVPKDKLAFIGGNLQTLKGALTKELAGNNKQDVILDLYGIFGSYEFSTDNKLEGTGKLEITEKNKNSLAYMFEKIDKLLTGLNDELK